MVYDTDSVVKRATQNVHSSNPTVRYHSEPLASMCCPHSQPISLPTLLMEAKRWRSWLGNCATCRKVAGSIPDGVIGNFHSHNPSGRTMAMGLTQRLTEMSARNISWWVKAAGEYGWQAYHLHVLGIWEPQFSGNLRACTMIVLLFLVPYLPPWSCI